jgi:hypothetical protein
MNPIRPLLLLLSAIFLFGCQSEDKTPEQIEREQIMEVEDLLRDNQWGFHDMAISVQYESRPIPLMVNVADENGMVQPGIYDSYAIFGDNSRQLDYTYEFTRDQIMADSSRSGEFYTVGTYYVLNTEQIRINPDTARAVAFNYHQNSEEARFTMSASSIYKQDLIVSINNAVIHAILADKPGKIATAFVEFLQENEQVSEAIQQFMYDLIHGRIEEITQSPGEKAEKLARTIVEKLGEVEWEDLLYERILEFLQNLQEENPEEKAAELALRMADKIEASLTKSDIYDVLLPILENFENETLAVLASQIAAALYQKMTESFSEENLYDRIYPVWEEFTRADSASVVEVADTLAGIVSAHFFDQETLKEQLIPFVQEIEDIPTLTLSQLAQDIIDSVLIPAVENMNESFPGLDLEPDWTTIKPVITSALTAVKAGLAASNVDEMANTLSGILIGVMDLAIQTGFEKAIFSLQMIPPDQAALLIASWITNLAEMAEQPVVDFIEEKLNAVFDRFEAEKATEALSSLIHSKVLEIFSEENLYQLFLPILETFQEADLEKIAETFAEWFIELDFVAGNITKEELIGTLTGIISELLSSIDPEESTTRLVELILESEIVGNLEGEILQMVLESKIYELILSVAGYYNAIDHVELIISQK